MNTTTANRRIATALLGILATVATTAFFGFLSTGINQGVAQRTASIQIVPYHIIIRAA